MNKKVKLIITDLDQTLLKGDKSVSEFALETLKKCKEQGISIAIATARSDRAAKRYVDLIKPDIVITNGGALARHNDEVIYKYMLSPSTSDELIKECVQHADFEYVSVVTETGNYSNSRDILESGGSYANVTYNNFEKPLNNSTLKITVEAYNKKSALELAAKYSECSFLTYTGENLCRFAHKDATKDYAIIKLAEHLNIDLTQIAAFGDDHNDIGMIKTCGYGVAVSNAIEEVRQVATHITYSNEEDGVAGFIQENFLL